MREDEETMAELEQRDAERDAQDAQRYEYVLTDDGLVVRESVR